jgi:hypothetical protein
MTSPFSERTDILMACRHILRSNGVVKKGRAFVMLALGRLDDHELTQVYWELLHIDQSVNNLPSTGKPSGFSLGTSEREHKVHIGVETEGLALCGVKILIRKPGPELTPQEAHQHASCKQCQYAVKLFEPVFLNPH